MTSPKRKPNKAAGVHAAFILTSSQKSVVRRVKDGLQRVRDLFATPMGTGFEALTASSSDKSTFQKPEGLRALRDRNLISILGGRGSGKTTVLECVLREVQAESPEAIVLRPIYPEAFLVGEHPIGWIASALKPFVDESVAALRAKKRGDDADQLVEAYIQFNNRVHTFLLVQGHGLESSGDTILRKSDLLAAAGESGLTLVQKLEELLRRLFLLRGIISTAKRAKSSLEPLLVVSFDDVDLYPNRVTRIMEVLPVLSRLPRTVVLIAADPSLLRAQLSRDCSELVSKDASSAAVQLAEDQFMKRMPWDLQFTLGGLTLAERLLFKPEGEHETLREILGGIQLRRTHYGPQTLLDFFDLSWNLGGPRETRGFQPTLYAKMLPSDPRSLLNLHGILSAHLRQLRHVMGNNPEGLRTDTYKQAFCALINDVIRFLSARNAPYLNLLNRVFDFDTYHNAVRIDASDLDAGITPTTRTLSDNDDQTLRIRRFFIEDKGKDLPASVSALINFTEELNLCPITAMYAEHLRTPGGLTSEQMPLRSKNRRFGWPRPHFDSFLIHESFDLRWETAVNWFATDDTAKEHRKPKSSFPHRLFLFYCYVSAILESVRSGGEPVPLSVSTQSLSKDSTWEPLVSRAAKVLTELSKDADARDDFAVLVHVDLNAWVARDLAWLSSEDAARDEAVAKRASWLRECISKAVPGLTGMLDSGKRDADKHRQSLDAVLPEVTLDQIDLEHLVRDIMEGKEQAIRTGLVALQMDRSPSRKRDALAGLMKQLGHKVPEARSELGGTGSPSREEATN